MQPTLIPSLLRRVWRPWARYAESKSLDRYSAAASPLLTQLAHAGRIESVGRAPAIISKLLTKSDVVVLMVGAEAGGAAQAALKLPLTPDAEQSLTRHRQVLIALHEIPALQGFRQLLPQPIAWGTHEERPYYLETALPGVIARQFLGQPAALAAMKQAAAQALLDLHSSTLQHSPIDEAAFARLAGNDLALLNQVANRWPEPVLLRKKLDRLGELLRHELLGQTLPLAWIHGDFWPGNLLIQPANGALSGVIDWDRADAEELPLHDLLHLLAYTRKLTRRTELGEEVVEYLLPAAFDAHERFLLDAAVERLHLPANAAFLRAAVLLYWLRFASANLSRYPARQTDARWLTKNVFYVLKQELP